MSIPLFEAASANFSRRSPAKVKTDLALDRGWREVADSVLSWLKEHSL